MVYTIHQQNRIGEGKRGEERREKGRGREGRRKGKEKRGEGEERDYVSCS